MKLTKVLGLVLLSIAVLGLVAVPAQAQTAVDLELSLLIDVSGSVNGTEFDLQRQGYINAFNNASIVSAIQSGAIGSIAVNMVYWSGSAEQQEAVGWTLVNDATSASNLATAIAGAARPFSGLTAPGSAINFAVPLFAQNNFDGTRMVIDVSGDGSQNDGSSTALARNAAQAAGITINGIAILGSEANLLTWYQDNVVTNDGFAIAATGFDTFGNAIDDKLIAEITDRDPTVPEPASMVLLTSGLLGMVGLRKKKA